MRKRTFSRALLAVVVMFGILAFSGILSAQGMSQEAFERVKEVQEMHTQHLLGVKGVEGTAIGLNRNARPALKVFVSKWDVAGIPKNLDGIPVQVVVTGKFYALAKPDHPSKPDKKPKPAPEEQIDPTARFDRPVPIGVSTGHPDITAGTIGCRVTDGTDVYALSNNHVYANSNDAELYDYVLQPGAYDINKNPDLNPDDCIIGTLADFVEIYFDGRNNEIDAAIALAMDSSSKITIDNATPSDGYGVPKKTTLTAAAALGQNVKKYGRTTGLTKGWVSAIGAIVNVTYNSGIARFENQIVISSRGPFSKGGDSGSLIVSDSLVETDDRIPIGLLFAGNNKFTIANPIDAVLDAFDVTIDGE